MGIIIACGKSILGKKYSNIKDLESSPFKKIIRDDLSVEKQKGTKREINSMWPHNYYNAKIKAKHQYDIVLVQLKPEHFDYFDNHNKVFYSLS